jgi:hypothetical protein
LKEQVYPVYRGSTFGQGKTPSEAKGKAKEFCARIKQVLARAGKL